MPSLLHTLHSTRRQQQLSEANLVASICRDDFYFFVQEFWGTIIQEAPVWNWHIPYLCGELQRAATRVFLGQPKVYDIIINIPPGTTKSTIVSVMFPAWIWCRMPHARCIHASHTYSLALDLSRKCRDVITSEKYQQCFPEIKLRDDQNTKGYFANHLGGMRFAVGVGGSVIGMHGHFLNMDDPIDPSSALSEADLAFVNRWCSETLPSRKVDKSVALTLLTMQRLHQDDPTGNLLAKLKEGIRHYCLPAELSEWVSPPELAAHYKDGLLDPIRLSPQVLKEAEQDLGQYGYAGQYRQHPVPPGGGMFKVDRVVNAPGCPTKGIRTPQSFTNVVRFWDKAATPGAGAFTVGTKVGVCPHPVTRLPWYWVLDVKRGQWASDERETIIRQTAMEDTKAVIIGLEQEPGSAGKVDAEATVRRLAGFRVRIDKPTGNKVLRADPYSVQVNAGAYALVEGAQWGRAWVEEHRFFPASTYKDQVDSGSGAYNMLAKPALRLGAV